MGGEIDEKARFFSEKVRSRLGGKVKKIFLFGSRARGDNSEGSDYDFVIILKQCDKESIDIIRDTEVEFLNTYDVLSSSLVYGEQEWKERIKLPIGVNIEREGIPV